MAGPYRALLSRFPGRCRGCGGKIQTGDEIAWSRYQGTYHARCEPEDPPDPRLYPTWEKRTNTGTTRAQEGA